MLHIAIVDCDTASCMDTITYIEKYFGYARIQIDEYSRGDSFLSAVLGGIAYDVIILEIDLAGLDGISVGTILRQYDTNENIYIIYISTNTDRLEHLFSIHPFDFIKKPICYETFHKTMSMLASHFKTHRKVLTVSIKKNLVNIPVNEITFIESLERKIVIHLPGKSYEAYGKLDNILQKITTLSDSFIKVHRSYAVNFSYVEKLSTKDITVNNMLIPIGPKYKSLISSYYSTKL